MFFPDDGEKEPGGEHGGNDKARDAEVFGKSEFVPDAGGADEQGARDQKRGNNHRKCYATGGTIERRARGVQAFVVDIDARLTAFDFPKDALKRFRNFFDVGKLAFRVPVEIASDEFRISASDVKFLQRVCGKFG